MPYNEEDTKLHLITPSLQSVGWTGTRMTMEFPITAGQILVSGDGHRQLPPKKADYLLRYAESLPIAIVEAKDESHTPGAGLQQAMEYAEKYGLYFAYSSNGHGIEEWDFTTQTQRSLAMNEMPTPDELWRRYTAFKQLEARPTTNPLLYPYWRDPSGRKKVRYYQEVAINRVIEQMVRGERRVLINLATGTGKTFIAFQIAWKLFKSDYFANKRVLFIADRVVLRGQAYNAFEPFQEPAGDPRFELESGILPNGRQVYFALYQGLYAKDQNGLRLFETLPPDFFDLIIIDECHRSGFGTWNEILQHFPGAVQLGMTATPKRTDNIDTYSYFGEPVFSYSLGQGIDDGFLATYKIHRVKTNVDANGIDFQDAIDQGATVEIPPDAEPRAHYDSNAYERELTLPDRIDKQAEHLTKLLKLYGRMEKTIVFCVSQDHAEKMRDALNRLNGDLNVANYTVRIVSEENDTKTWLEKFQQIDRPTPVIATTVDLLTTGVDAPSVRNIVFLRRIESPTVFKQIIGRGTRLCEDTDKYWFRIIDYMNATRLFDGWDIPTPPIQGSPTPAGPRNCWVAGKVLSEDNTPIVSALVTVQLGPNEVIQQRTGGDGQFLFPNLPAGDLQISVSAYGHSKQQSTVVTQEGQPQLLTFALKKSQPPRDRLIRMSGINVEFVDEKYEERDAAGNLVSPEDYLRAVREEIKAVCADLVSLQLRWSDTARRKELLTELENHAVAVDVLHEILQRPDADSYDLLAHIAFDAEIHSREERATALFNLHQDFFNTYNENARNILRVLVEKYVLGGLDEVTDPQVFMTAPIRREIGQVAPLFGGIPHLIQAREQLIQYIYQPGN